MRARAFGSLVPAAALLLAGCSSENGGPAPTGAAPPMRLVAYDSCDDLLSGLRKATAERVGPYGLGGDGVLYGRQRGTVPGAPAPESADQGATAGAAKGAAPAEHSRTNAHEAGADEPDLVKTDGRRIVALARNRLQVIDPATRKVAHRLDLPGLDRTAGSDPQLLLHGDRALVMSAASPLLMRGDTPTAGPDIDRPGPTSTPQTRLTLVDLSGAPKVLRSMTSDSAYVDARQTGQVARVVVRSTPRIDFPRLPATPGAEKQALERNRQAVMKAPVSAWLPSFEGGKGGKHTVPCDQVSRAADFTGTSMLTVLTFDLTGDLGDPQAVSVAAEGQTVYGTGKALYVTGTPAPPVQWGKPAPAPEQAPEQHTDVHMFSTAGGGRPRYEASGTVPGNLLNQYSMSDDGTSLRVATTTGQSFTGSGAPRSQSAVRVLQRRGKALQVVGTLDGLGKGERIYSVRFLGATAYVVTFRQTDPLYVVDLKDATKPRVTGELKINGYSAYLHPTADGRLLGVGQDADARGRTKGTQVSLFDVSAAPRRVGVYQLQGTGTQAEFDPHAFLYWPKSGLTVIPITRHRDGGSQALVLKVDRDGLRRTGAIEHPDGGNGYPSPIQRSLMVGDTLWTFSADGARATDSTTLKEGGWLAY